MSQPEQRDATGESIDPFPLLEVGAILLEKNGCPAAAANIRLAAKLLSARSEIAPKGWKLVPEEPTKEMIVAGQDEHDNCIDTGYDSDADGNRHDYTTISPDAPSRVYLAMINAAPRGPQGSVGSGTSEGSEGNRPHPAGAAPVSVPSAIREFTPVGLFWQTADGRRHFCEGAFKRGDIHDNGRPIHIALLGEEAK